MRTGLIVLLVLLALGGLALVCVFRPAPEIRTAPDLLPAGEPRLIAPCRCMGCDDLVPCGCPCHRIAPVRSPQDALAAFRRFDAVHCPWGTADRALEVLEAKCRFNGADTLVAGYRVLCRFRDDQGERGRGLDFPVGATAPTACWETPARSRTLTARAFKEQVIDPRLFGIVKRHLLRKGQPGFEAARTNAHATLLVGRTAD